MLKKNLVYYFILVFLFSGLALKESYSSDDEETSEEYRKQFHSQSHSGDDESWENEDDWKSISSDDDNASSRSSSRKQPPRPSKKRPRDSDKVASLKKVQDVSSDEDSGVDPEKGDAPFHKRRKKSQGNSFSSSTSNQQSKSSSASSKNNRKKLFLKDDSDEEGGIDEYLQGFCPITELGTRVKLLANIYLRNIDQTANVFLPKYFLVFKGPEGKLRTTQDFFKTQSGTSCVFVSGGIYNTWEKNIEYIYNLFFNYKFKIIRSTWIYKHLKKDKGITRDLEKEFSGRENELHSELYYDLFFRNFFIDSLPDIIKQAQKPGEQLQSISIKGFSWWAVCNSCDHKLSDHGRLLFEKGLLPSKDQLSYEIIARRHYNHAYPSSSLIKKTTYVGHRGGEIEKNIWNKVWQSICTYATKNFESKRKKELFWTTTKEGLEVCKWLGQGFGENLYQLDGKKSKVGKNGDILKYYLEKEDQEKDREEEDQQLNDFRKLLTYLSKKNWDLSCWYFSPYPGGKIQQKWKTHWKQVIMPHFNWEEIDIEEDSSEADDNEFEGTQGANYNGEKEKDISKDNDPRTCQMCGYEGLTKQYVVFPTHC